MQLYDKYLASIEAVLSSLSFQSKLASDLKAWPSEEETEIVFKNDEAFELGEPFGLSASLATSSLSSDQDEVLLYGKDLEQIKTNASYARLVFVKVKDEAMGKGNALFQSIRKIDYVRYHVSPKGYMMTISPLTHHEGVRVSKKAIQNQISFFQVGKTFIEAYRKLDFVETVKVIFISLEDFDYKKLEEIIVESEGVTKALDHLSNKVKMDCHSCALQKVCDEVEALTKEDFSKEK